MRRWLMVVLVVLLALPAARGAGAEEAIPPSPSPHYIVDGAGILSAGAVREIDGQLETFERETSNQIVVAIYPRMESGDDLAAYAVRVYQKWKIGQKGKDNGALLLIFAQDRRMNITTGYGLEGALPDATCKAIIETEIKPRFQAGDYDGGVRAGVNAMMAATRGEYKGTGRLAGAKVQSFLPCCFPMLIMGFVVLTMIAGLARRIYGNSYSARGRLPWWVIPLIWLASSTRSGMGGGWGGGGWGGGGGGGGGFSGGGGRTGGGGASGSW